MTEQDKETYLYQMKYAQFLYEKNGKKALDDLEEYEIRKMKRIWNGIGEKHGRDLGTLIHQLWGNMGSDFEYSITKQTDTEVQIECRKCPFVSLSLDNGMKEVGYSKYCMSDYGIVEGFNPRIEFTRTKTLMEGKEICNHHYKMKG